MLIALVFSTASIQAQSARRSVTHDNKERTRTSTTHKNASTPQKVRSSQPDTKLQAQHVRSQSARKVQTQQVRREQTKYMKPAPNNKGRQYVRNQNANKNNGSQVRKPVSITTSRNPRSTYKKANNKITTGPRHTATVRTENYKGRNYYGGKHYHYAYPTRKVKFHYHHNTYVNHYNLLYYPSYGNIYWTRNMYRDYRHWYPEYHWRYDYGYRIKTISIFDARYNLGEVAMVYGRVYASWHNNETDDYLLFFGGDFPYQQFTVVVPGHVARRFSWRPERYFLGEHITVTGLITTFDGSPEITVNNKRQLGLY